MGENAIYVNTIKDNWNMAVSEIIESKCFHCDTCGDLVMKIIFAPGCLTAIDINEVAIAALSLYETDENEVWIIGDSLDLSDEDAPHPSWKRKPQFSMGPENIRPSEFNKRIVNAQENHCR